MSYTHQLTITVPIYLIDVAKGLSQAFDEDSGGHLAFETETYSTPVKESFASVIQYLQANPEYLYESTLRDYQSRWPNDTPPTLEEVTAFCTEAIIQVTPRN